MIRIRESQPEYAEVFPSLEKGHLQLVEMIFAGCVHQKTVDLSGVQAGDSEPVNVKQIKISMIFHEALNQI